MHTIKSRSQKLAEFYDSANRPHPIVEEFLALAKYRELILQFVLKRAISAPFWV